MSEKRIEISQLGEFGLIDRINRQFTLKNESSLKGIGDDAAVIQASGDECMLVSTDMLVEGIHFDLSYVPIQHLGYKAVAVNVSDIAAMNGKAEQITVSIALSNRFSVEAVDALYQGIKTACENYNVDLVGGDTTSSAAGLVISITVLGRAPKSKIVYRKGAQVNDIICVTGDLGAAFMGLQVLEREKQVFMADPGMQPSLEKYEYMVGRQLKPEARTDIVFDLEEAGVKPTSMIDVSDGLVSELFHLSRHSEVGIRIYEDKVPIDHMTFETAVEFKLDPITCALNGGEDYELLFTIRQEDQEKIKKHPDIHMIGYVHDRKNERVMITKQGNTVPLRAQGWDHFTE
ncbi:thiamine-phosphate kinase [Fulvivirgaceae bacterium PWU4]|uniref:Thiamine-monophosphate kinase n=1 Tax=Chryseosolibacter histidini TaxID=2782349 RepID=A0AAP2DP30_9BACT|nr:thiamine-phosphate kinase [Chryseosolibacter histidini]MBT1699945.1 thiamine-phosphate kinase [Chryseosolibacter histidini]